MKDLKILEGIGSIDMKRCYLYGGIDLYLEMESLANEMIEPVNKAIEQAKEEYNKDYAEEMEQYHYKWSDKGVVITPVIYISSGENILNGITEGKINLIIYFEDKVNNVLSSRVNVNVDLSKYRKEIFTMIVDACKRELKKLK